MNLLLEEPSFWHRGSTHEDALWGNMIRDSRLGINQGVVSDGHVVGQAGLTAEDRAMANL